MMHALYVLVILVSSALSAPHAPLALHTTVSTDLSASYAPEQDAWTGRGNTLLTFGVIAKKMRYARFGLEIDLTHYYGVTADELVGLSHTSDLLMGGAPGPLALKIRKMYLSFYTPLADILIGRNIINFGKGFVFSPLDVYNTVQISDVAFRRFGSDMVQVCMPWGDLSGFDIIGSLEESQGAPLAIKTYTTLAGWDFDLIAIYKQKKYETDVGVSFKGDMLVGVYGELVQHFIKEARNRSFRGMLGIDYSVGTYWRFMAEYYYREKSLGIYSTEAGYGKNNLFGSVHYTINELMYLSGTTLLNVTDAFSLSTIQYFYNVMQNTDMILYVRSYAYTSNFVFNDVACGMRVRVKF